MIDACGGWGKPTGWVPPERWVSLFQQVDQTEVAADLLEYSTCWRTPDGAEKMPPLTMQQAQTAADTVLAFLNDAMNKGRREA